MNLPKRNQQQIIFQGRQVMRAPTNAKREELSKRYGINGVPVLSKLSSLSFPDSFPYEFMHLVFENLLKNLANLWTGDFKGMDQGRGSYELPKTVLEVIGEAKSESGDTIPSAFAARPRSFTDERTNMTADMWSFWGQYLGPVLLKRRFTHEKYYTHYIKLVRIIRTCLQFHYTRNDRIWIQKGINEWVVEFEKCVSSHHILLRVSNTS